MQFTSPADALAELVRRHGGAVSTALLDPACEVFQADGIEGAIGFRRSLGCAVAIGDPVCAPENTAALAEAFRAYCRDHGWHTAYVVTGAEFTRWAVERGYASIEFGHELILDPQRDPCAGSAGRELRKKIYRTARQNVEAGEYVRPPWGERETDAELAEVAAAWLAGRTGPQIFLNSVRLFEEPEGKRWFYARHHGRAVGVLVTQRLDARDGYLLDHILTRPDAPDGTSELLITSTLQTLRAEGCGFATFGPAPGAQLGEIHGLGKLSATVARNVFDAAGRAFHLDSRTRFRQKFQVARTEPAALLFDPPRIGVREIVGILRAFNVSLPRGSSVSARPERTVEAPASLETQGLARSALP